ncbi:MAG: ATP-binding protein [Melioribacteraceae bacterium]|nr:ATP-binding protein [Melioribacteraceae bacterium]
MKKLSIQNRIENLEKVAEFVELFGEEHGLDSKTSFELNLILDELVTNIINYAYDDEDKHIIEIVLEKSNNTINIQTIDDGEEFNPLKKNEVNVKASLEDRKIGGLGIHIVKQKTDDISYERKEGRNILNLIKKL